MNTKEFPSEFIKYEKPGRASVLTSAKGSITLEASMAVPVFFFAVICLLYLMEIMCIRTAVRSGLQYAGKITAQEASAAAVVSPSKLEGRVVNAIGAGRLNRSIVEGGSSGIDCSGSYLSPGTGIGEIKAKYKIHIPVPIFHIPPVEYSEKMRIKAWTGYEASGFGSDDSETVYVTETGLVYHKDYHCTYLELSIRKVPAGEVKTLRNTDGGKYYPCEHCAGGAGQGVYITDSGDRYHSSLSCSGLKRTIYAIPVSEAAGKGECSRCGQ